MKAHAVLCKEHHANLRASDDGAAVTCERGCVIAAIELKDAAPVFFATADGSMYVAPIHKRKAMP